MLRMPVEVKAKGKGEKYIVSIPAYTCKEDLKQVIEDSMLIRNRNFIQSAEMVCLKLLCTCLISVPNYSFILMRSSACGYNHPKHDLPTPRVSYSVEGCRELAALLPISRF